jgi:hypothetical protein
VIDGNFAQVYKVNDASRGVTFEVSDNEGYKKSFSF